MSAGAAEEPRRRDGGDLLPVDELVRRTPGAHPISSVDELRYDAFKTDEELDEFLAFVGRARRADVGLAADADRRPWRRRGRVVQFSRPRLLAARRGALHVAEVGGSLGS